MWEKYQSLIYWQKLQTSSSRCWTFPLVFKTSTKARQASQIRKKCALVFLYMCTSNCCLPSLICVVETVLSGCRIQTVLFSPPTCVALLLDLCEGPMAMLTLEDDCVSVVLPPSAADNPEITRPLEKLRFPNSKLSVDEDEETWHHKERRYCSSVIMSYSKH